MGFFPCLKGKKSSKGAEKKSVLPGKMDVRFNKDCLDEHNRLRKLHGCPLVKLSENLAKSAQNWAAHLVNVNRLEHSTAEDYGENLATRYSSNECSMTGKQATLIWYSEIKDYRFNEENQLNCGHFSQVVWNSTKEAGFGWAASEDGHKIFVVGQYSPPGNFTNEWVQNVPAPLSGAIYIPTDEDLGKR